jgi:hypothetical protein
MEGQISSMDLPTSMVVFPENFVILAESLQEVAKVANKTSSQIIYIQQRKSSEFPYEAILFGYKE